MILINTDAWFLGQGWDSQLWYALFQVTYCQAFFKTWIRTPQAKIRFDDLYMYCLIEKYNYPNNPQKLTGVSTTTHFVQIALKPKQPRIVWTFQKQNICLGQVVIQ